MSQWDPMYCLVMGELNRRHRLDMLMETWKAGMVLAQQEVELERCRTAIVTDEITLLFSLHWDEWAQAEDCVPSTIRAVALAMQRFGVRFFFKNRWRFLDLEKDHDEEMFGDAAFLATIAFAREVSPWDVPLRDFYEEP